MSAPPDVSGETSLDPDVIVVGSGAAGMVAALRASDLGLSAILIEKCHLYGGTTALSGGGMWVPLNPSVADENPETAMAYLKEIVGEKANHSVLRAYVDNALRALDFLHEIGAGTAPMVAFADYFSEVQGARFGRGRTPLDFDGKQLGDELFTLRDGYPLMAFGRYSLNARQAFLIGSRQRGWLLEAIGLAAKYWLDIPWRLKTRIDRRLTFGRALIGALRKAMLDRDIPLLLNHRLVKLDTRGDSITGITIERHGERVRMPARAVILAAGGFEQNQQMRELHHRVPTSSQHSLTPPGANEGDAIRAGQAIGAAVAHMEHAWWEPTVRFPLGNSANTLLNGDLFFSRGRPGALCVNRLGRRFCNEAMSYDRFGHAMIADQLATGANLPCWMIFDARFRAKWPAGAIRPAWIMPDRAIPPGWWDNVVYRAHSIRELAAKIALDGETLERTVNTFNRYCADGKDPEFARGDNAYDRGLGDPACAPNPNLGPLLQAPFYALPVELGDIGTKGGLTIDEHARVLDRKGRPLPGLYAAGNTTASIFADTYPGPGATLGAAITMGFVAANHLAASLGRPDSDSGVWQ